MSKTAQRYNFLKRFYKHVLQFPFINLPMKTSKKMKKNFLKRQHWISAVLNNLFSASIAYIFLEKIFQFSFDVLLLSGNFDHERTWSNGVKQ